MKNVIQNLYKLERKYENLLDEHQEIREDQEIEEEELFSDCIKLAEELPKRECQTTTTTTQGKQNGKANRSNHQEQLWQ